MDLNVKTSKGSYNITIGSGALDSCGRLLDLNRKILIVTDKNVPIEYSNKVLNASKKGHILVLEGGEECKNIESYVKILNTLVENDFTRTDAVVSVGGGVIGDMAGFAAATFMRGIDFYNIPTTVLSQVDSSIGGKVAIDFANLKNIVGAFYPPKAVLIDPDTLKTLPKRQIANGLCEAVKMAASFDEELFKVFEENDVIENPELLPEIIYRSLKIKKMVVEEDETETGIRKALNYGHTLAHAIESANNMQDYYHGECVAMGMIPMSSKEVQNRLKPVLEKLGLPSSIEMDREKIMEAVKHDKKMQGETLTAIYVPKIGSFELKKMTVADFVENVF